MDEFDDWPISDEEIKKYNIHVNDHPAETCETCQEIRKHKEERTRMTRRIEVFSDGGKEPTFTWSCSCGRTSGLPYPVIHYHTQRDRAWEEAEAHSCLADKCMAEVWISWAKKVARCHRVATKRTNHRSYCEYHQPEHERRD